MTVDEFFRHFRKKHKEIERRRFRLAMPPDPHESNSPDQWHYVSTVVGLPQKQYFGMIKKNEKL